MDILAIDKFWLKAGMVVFLIAIFYFTPKLAKSFNRRTAGKGKVGEFSADDDGKKF